MCGIAGIVATDRLHADERARLTVTKRIRGVLERIASRHPPLAEHLGRTIRTGLLCAYIPDPELTTHWSL